MKGSTIAAMVMAAAAASAATIFALKKAHDKKLENACNCDDLPEGGCRCTEESEEETCFCENSAEDACCCTEDEADTCCCETDETTEEKAEDGCCADGVCSFGGDDAAAVDQPAQIHMPEDLDEADEDPTEKA